MYILRKVTLSNGRVENIMLRPIARTLCLTPNDLSLASLRVLSVPGNCTWPLKVMGWLEGKQISGYRRTFFSVLFSQAWMSSKEYTYTLTPHTDIKLQEICQYRYIFIFMYIYTSHTYITTHTNTHNQSPCMWAFFFCVCRYGDDMTRCVKSNQTADPR